MSNQSDTQQPDSDGTVLIAYDGSDHAKAAIEQAGRELLTPRHAVVLTVQPPLDSAALFGTSQGSIPDDLLANVAEQAAGTAREGAELAGRVGFDAEAAVRRGRDPAWRQILDGADEFQAAVIAIGSHGRTGLSRMVMGSVANAVVQHSDRPVFIARI